MRYKIDKDRLTAQIDEAVSRWDVSGTYMVQHEGEVLYKRVFGMKDRDKQVPYTERDSYIFSTRTSKLVNMCVMLLADMGKLRVTDTLGMYIPELKKAAGVTIEDLLRNNTGIRDWFYGKVMLELEADEAYHALDDREHYIYEHRLLYDSVSFERLVELIGDNDIEVCAADDEDSSESNVIILIELVERLSGMTLTEFECSYIFAPCGMTQTKQLQEDDFIYYRYYDDKELIPITLKTREDTFVTTCEDISKLVNVACRKELLSKRMWTLADKFSEFEFGIFYGNANGTNCLVLGTSAVTIYAYFDRKLNLQYMHLSNADIKIDYVRCTIEHFRKAVREEIEAAFTYPDKTKLVPYGVSVCYKALALSILKEQESFVLMEEDRGVGLLILYIDKKLDKYGIDTVIIDKRFQGRGFGKIMLTMGIEYLKKCGAKELEIGVARKNVAARRLYESLGFKHDMVYDSGMNLKLIIE